MFTYASVTKLTLILDFSEIRFDSMSFLHRLGYFQD